MNVIVITLINYYGENELVSFVRDYLLKQKDVHLKIVIVDNGSNDQSSLAALESVNVHVIFPDSNLGYFGGAQCAMDHFVRTHGQIPELFIVSNFDLEFDKTNFLQTIWEKCLNSEASVFGPSITSSLNGAELNPIYQERFTLNHLNRILLVTSNYVLFFIYQKLHYLKRGMKGRQRISSASDLVYAVHGSFMIFKKSFFDRGGTLSYGSFLYGEEIFVAEQCRLLGLFIEFLPELKVIHHEHATTGRMKDSKHMKWLNASMQYLKRRFYDV